MLELIYKKNIERTSVLINLTLRRRQSARDSEIQELSGKPLRELTLPDGWDPLQNSHCIYFWKCVIKGMLAVAAHLLKMEQLTRKAHREFEKMMWCPR